MIILMGPVGSGKSVQGKLLTEKIPSVWISTGELLRKSTDSEIKKILASGELVSDDQIRGLLAAEIKNISKDQEVILDGFPRRVSQAEWLDELTKPTNSRIRAVIHIHLSNDEAIKRMVLRGRSDDSAEAIATRNQAYEEQVKPVIDYYKQQGLLHEIDGDGTVEEVHKRVMAVVMSSTLDQ
jgi:adenylate kinase